MLFASWRGRNAADHEIVGIVSADPDPASIRVVTSDRRLVERVRELSCGAMSSMSFRRRLTSTIEVGRTSGE